MILARGTDTFIEGAKYLTNIIDPERDRYYENSLNGLHYPASFAELWNRTYPSNASTR